MTATVPETPASRPPTTGADPYDVFVSYAREADGALATALQRGLAGLAKPWYRRRALRVFLDTASLSASSELGGSIAAALAGARYFILLASPAAADRPWVDREVAWWREHREPGTFLIADTGAGLRWDHERGDFASASRIPPSLRGWFAAEPAWTDLSWAHSATDVSLRNPRFREKVAELASPARGMAKDALVGEDIRQHRRALRLAWIAGAALLVLAVVATVAAILAVIQRHQAIVQRDTARSQALAALAEANSATAPLTSLEEATRGWSIHQTPQAVRALRGTLAVPLRRVLKGGEDVTELEFSRDGRQLAVSAPSGIGLWDLPAGSFHAVLRPDPEAIENYDFSFAGRRIASLGTVGACHMTRGRCVGGLAVKLSGVSERPRTRTLRVDEPEAVTLSPDGRHLAVATASGTVEIRDLLSGRTSVLEGRDRSLWALAFSHDGSRVLSYGPHGVRVWSSVRAGPPLTIPTRGVVAARVDSSGRVVTVNDNRTLMIWSPDGHRLRRQEIGTGDGLTISPDGRFVAVGADRIAVWNVADGTRRVIGSHPGGSVKALAFGPGNRTLASAANGDALIRVWDLRTAPPARLPGRFPPDAVLFSPRGDHVAAVQYAQGAVAVWPRVGGPPRVHPGQPYLRLLATAFAGDGRAILAISDDGRLWRIDVATGRRTVVRDLGSADDAAFSPDGRWFAVGGDASPLRLYAVAGGPPKALAPHVPRTAGLCVGAGGRVAVSDASRHVAVWDARGRQIRLTAPAPIITLAFSPSGESLAGSSGEAASSVYLWRGLRSGGSRPALLAESAHFVNDLAFAPDGSAVAGAIDGGPPELWGIDDGARISLTAGARAVLGGPAGLWNIDDGQGDGADTLAFDRAGTAIAFGVIAKGSVEVLNCKACGTAGRLVTESRHLLRRGGVD